MLWESVDIDAGPCNNNLSDRYSAQGVAMADYERLSALDRSFLELESRDRHMHVGGVFVFEAASLFSDDGAVDLAAIKTYVASRLHLVPRYRQRIAWIPLEGHPVWVDDEDFDVGCHVRHVQLPAPGGEAEFKRVCSQLFSCPLDRDRPLWEFWIITGLDEGRVAMLCKAHHCMVDGVAGMGLVQAMFSLTPEKEVEPPLPWRARPVPGGAQLLSEAVLRRLELSVSLGGAVLGAWQNPLESARGLAESILGVAEIAAAGLWPASASPINKSIGPDRRFDWVAFDLDAVKRIRRAFGGTLNDVVLAVVAGAVGRFFEERGMSRREQARLDFRAYCPVNVRAESEQDSLGNRVSAMITALPIAERDPARRLCEVTRTTARLKASRQAMGAETVASLADWTLPSLFSAVSRFAFNHRSSNLIVSNVAGPPVPLYLLGGRLLECYPLVPLFGDQTLGVALFSYAGGLYWGLNSERHAFSELPSFVEALDQSFQELSECAESLRR